VGVWGTAVDTVRLAGRVDQRSLVAYASGHSRQGHQLYALTIAQWWWLLPAAGVPAWVGAALAAVMALAGGASLVRAARGPPRREASPPDR
jgi:hypothetical protein